MAKPESAARMKRKAHEKQLEKLQVELCHLQEWVKAGAKIQGQDRRSAPAMET
jgi:polyphosphate kinase 2 (PPK2 family)